MKFQREKITTGWDITKNVEGGGIRPPPGSFRVKSVLHWGTKKTKHMSEEHRQRRTERRNERKSNSFKKSQLSAFLKAIVNCYLEFKLWHLKNVNLFSNTAKELLEPIVLWEQKCLRDCSIKKHFLEKPTFE